MSQPDLFKPSVLSVSELTADIKALLEGHFLDLKVEGEISNAKKSANGHVYFTLKDEDAQLSCVVWRSVAQRLGIELQDGQQVVAGGDIQLYPPHGRYQLIIRSVEQAGIGALQQAFEKLKAKLKAEGLFEDVHKVSLPRFPERIGVITSATGAAFHDIRDTLQQRWPLTTVILHHASVQGVNAAPELVKAIDYFSGQQKPVDLLIVGRGGGSLEDLWPFNEEAVARALFACPIPTISAVGHEVDFSISDFVADARAATPTQAAIIATPDANEIRLALDDVSTRITHKLTSRIGQAREGVQRLLHTYALQAVEQQVLNRKDQLQRLKEQLQHRQALFFMQKREQLTALTHRLEQNNPQAALQRGFVRVEQGDQWIRKAAKLNTKETFAMIWEDGVQMIEKG